MRAFLKSMDERIWLSVVNCWFALGAMVNNVVTPTSIENLSKAKLDSCN